LKEYVNRECVLCYLFDNKKEIFLAKGNKNKTIGANLWNGYGGGIKKKDRSLQRAVIREVYEKTGGGVVVSPFYLKKMGEITFCNHKSDALIMIVKVHLFFSNRWFGRPEESEEMREPTLFKIDRIPFDNMMLADRHFLPILLRGDKIKAEYCYSSFRQTLIGFPQLKFVNSF